MKLSRVAIVLGSLVSVTGVGVFAGACSSSSSGSGNPTQPVVDSGSASSSDDAGEDTGSSSETDASSSCGTTPTLHPSKPDGGLYCPFGAAADGGDLTLYCTSPANLCCVSGELSNNTFPPSTCESSCNFTATKGNTTVECEDPATDCPTGNICCGGASSTIKQATGCSYDKLSDWVYTKCEAAKSCATAATAPATGAEFQLCTSNAECASGQTCTPFKAKGIDMGYCM